MPKKVMPKLGEDIYEKDQIYMVPKPKPEETIEPGLWGKPVKGIEKDWFYDPHYYEHGRRSPWSFNFDGFTQNIFCFWYQTTSRGKTIFSNLFGIDKRINSH